MRARMDTARAALLMTTVPTTMSCSAGDGKRLRVNAQLIDTESVRNSLSVYSAVILSAAYDPRSSG